MTKSLVKVSLLVLVALVCSSTGGVDGDKGTGSERASEVSDQKKSERAW